MTAADQSPVAPDGERKELESVDCVVIAVTYNSADRIEAFLDSIPPAAGALSVRCLIVDNDSRDGTVALVRGRPDVFVVESGANLGYSGAINLARVSAGPRSALLIANPDVVLERDALSDLYAALGERGVGVTVPRLLCDDGGLYMSLRREPTVSRSLGDALLGARVAGRPGWLSETIRDPQAYETARDVDWASGAMLMISGECDCAVGPWDAGRFFLYAEETDFAARARRCGYRIRYVPSARARHEIGASGSSHQLAALLAVNRVRYFEKYHRGPRRHLYRGTIVLQHLLRGWDTSHRAALNAVCRRSRWPALPSAGAASQRASPASGS